MAIRTEQGQLGRIESAFGKTGKFKIYFSNPVELTPGTTVYIDFKRYLFDESNSMKQWCAGDC